MRPYGGSEPNTIRSAGIRASSVMISKAFIQELSYTIEGWSREAVGHHRLIGDTHVRQDQAHAGVTVDDLDQLAAELGRKPAPA